MRPTARAWMVMIAAFAAACAPPPEDAGRTGPALPGQSAAESSRRDRNRVTAEELEELRSRGATDLLGLIQRARPNWLRTRRTDMGPGAPLILYNERRLAGPGDLRNIPSAVVQTLEYIAPPASQGRYGVDATYGVIIIRGQ